MIITKNAQQQGFLQDKAYYKSARSALQDILSGLHFSTGDVLYLPNYIGISPQEGSGIYDPVMQTNTPHTFYALDEQLHIDVKRLGEQIIQESRHIKAILLVHYFGFVDPSLIYISRICRDHKIILIEDCAHAFYTEYVDHACGQIGDVVIYSLHKMLPCNQGGLLKWRATYDNIRLENALTNIPAYMCPFSYDIAHIADIRKRNAVYLLDELDKRCLTCKLRPLVTKKQVLENTPQTLPVQVLFMDRFQFYNELNGKGFGVVSLYHTLIEPLQRCQDSRAFQTSQIILNLPVHQDADEESLSAMMDYIELLVKEREDVYA